MAPQENPPASAAKLEEVVAASVEPEPTPEKDLKARRLEAIRAKALEIMKVLNKILKTILLAMSLRSSRLTVYISK